MQGHGSNGVPQWQPQSPQSGSGGMPVAQHNAQWSSGQPPQAPSWQSAPHQGQGSAPVPPAGRRRWLPWALCCSGLLVLAVFALIVAIVVGMVMHEDGSAGGGSKPAANTQEVETQRLSITMPDRWEKADLSNQKFARLDGLTVHEVAMWQWFEKEGDPMAREIALYQFYGPKRTPQTTKVDPHKVDTVLDQAVTRIGNLSSSELTSMLSSEGHGCMSDASFVTKPKRVTRSGLEGVEFTFDCTGSKTGTLGLRGTHTLYVDEYGDQHTFTITSDDENFKANSDEMQAAVESVKLK